MVYASGHHQYDFCLGLKKKNIAIFASGGGTNAEKIIQHFQHHANIRISAVYTNNPGAGVIQRAQKYQVPVIVFNRKDLYQTSRVADQLQQQNTFAIVLAGFLWLVPTTLINLVSGNMVNIHPALLPDYGGAGMYGMNVHQAVIKAKEIQSGITIHLVNEEYDKGQILYQAKCSVDNHDTPETLAQKIHQLEYQHFAPQIEKWVLALG